MMITVADNSVDGRLVNKVNRAIQAMLENKQIEATVLSQAIASSDRGVNQTEYSWPHNGFNSWMDA